MINKYFTTSDHIIHIFNTFDSNTYFDQSDCNIQFVYTFYV